MQTTICFSLCLQTVFYNWSVSENEFTTHSNYYIKTWVLFWIFCWIKETVTDRSNVQILQEHGNSHGSIKK